MSGNKLLYSVNIIIKIIVTYNLALECTLWTLSHLTRTLEGWFLRTI